MNMTKTELWQFSTWGTKSAHCATCAFSRHAGFSQIWSHIHSVSFSAMAQFVYINWGGKTLHFEGYIYTKIRDGANGFQFWRCQSHKAGWIPSKSHFRGKQCGCTKGAQPRDGVWGRRSGYRLVSMQEAWLPMSTWQLSSTLLDFKLCYVPSYFPFFHFFVSWFKSS